MSKEEEIVAAAGAVYEGIKDAVVYFRDPKTQIIHELPVSLFSAEAVQKKMSE